MYSSKITGLGCFVPENVVTNQELSELMETNDAWIQERTGIKERRWFTPGEHTVYGMGTEAAKMAIENAGLTSDDIDFIIFATLSPDYQFPGPGVFVQRELGIKEIGALDVRNQCSGFVYGISVADQFIKTGMYKNILVIGSEIQSSGMDKTTRGRGISVIFGDGAGAAVVSRTSEEGKGILSTHLHSEGKHSDELMLKGPSSNSAVRMYKGITEDVDFIYPYMNGNAVFKHAVTRFMEVIGEALATNGYQPSDINLLVPHQANIRITQYVGHKLGLGPDVAYSNIHKYGNTTAASIPLALYDAWKEGKVNDGDLVCLAAFGSGFTWASALIRW